MNSSRKKNFCINTIFLLLLTATFFLNIFGNVENVQAESSLKVNFPKESIVEHLKLEVPKKFKGAWLKAEEETWEPWLLKQYGFLGRQLYWDPKVEEATLLIAWESRLAWKSISQSEINLVQKNFERIARVETGQMNGNPFPLIFEGELKPQ